MTLTPDRRHGQQDRRGDAASPAVGASGGESDCGTESSTDRELVRDAGFDLDGHPTADRFDEAAALLHSRFIAKEIADTLFA